MAQQAKPNVIGQMLPDRAQLIACSSDVVMTFSSNRPSIQGWVIGRSVPSTPEAASHLFAANTEKLTC